MLAMFAYFGKYGLSITNISSIWRHSASLEQYPDFLRSYAI